MAISVSELFDAGGLTIAGAVKWGQRIPFDEPGIYVVSSAEDPSNRVGEGLIYAPDPIAFEALRDLCPNVAVDGTSGTNDELAARIGAFWIPDSPVLYIGMAGTSVQKRVNQYYATHLGHRSPHAGGWWLKTLAGLENLYVHYAPAADPKAREAALLRAYAESVPKAVRTKLFDPERIAPFANIEVSPGNRKRHGLSGYKTARAVTRN
jgi:hypothetical protein